MSPLSVKKSRSLLSSCAERDLYRAIPAMTRDLGFHGLTRFMDPRLIASYDKLKTLRTYSNQDSHGRNIVHRYP